MTNVAQSSSTSTSSGLKKPRPRSVIVSPSTTSVSLRSASNGATADEPKHVDDASPPVSPRTRQLRDEEKKAALHAKIGRLERQLESKRAANDTTATTSSTGVFAQQTSSSSSSSVVEPDDVTAMPLSPGERPAWWFDNEEAAQRANSPQVRFFVIFASQQGK